MIIANFGEMNIRLYLDKGCKISIKTKRYYDSYNICTDVLNICDIIVIHIGNGDIQIHFFIVLPLLVQQVVIQLHFNKARTKILFGKDAFDQLHCQDYTNRIVCMLNRLQWLYKKTLQFQLT